jgi:hypothetical protein
VPLTILRYIVCGSFSGYSAYGLEQKVNISILKKIIKSNKHIINLNIKNQKTPYTNSITPNI